LQTWFVISEIELKKIGKKLNWASEWYRVDVGVGGVVEGCLQQALLEVGIGHLRVVVL
jgi:hypothetical protein